MGCRMTSDQPNANEDFKARAAMLETKKESKESLETERIRVTLGNIVH